jgi:hypothetical protein
MKRIILFLSMAVLLSGPLMAQYHPGGPEVTVDRDSLLAAGMDELLSYMLLTRNDFIFRNDYTDPDPFRLPIIDSLMKHPLLMNPFTADCISRFARFSDDPDALLFFLAYIAKGGIFAEIPTAKRTGNISSDDAIKNIAGKMVYWSREWEENAGKNLTAEDRAFLTDKFPQLILEDPADKYKSAEEQDSISKVEEQYALDVVNMGEKIRFPQFPRLGEVIHDLEIIKDSGMTNQDPVEPAWAKEVGMRIVIGSVGDDTYRGDYDIIIDPGGNDNYYLTYDPAKPHSVIIADFSGNDTYTAESDFGLACGAFGYSLLIDYDGDDIYRGGNFSLGAGYFGVGILWDKKGNDSYFGDTFTQGAGTFGLGLLIDSDGSDTYTGNLFCQGFGFVDGIGGVIDNTGNDVYTVQPKYGDFIRYNDHYISLSQGFGYGIRPFLSGGFGFIADYAGNDIYVSDIFGQGASYWWSLGMLYDKSGNDEYLSHQYAQGNGTHMSLGILRDDAGNDIYRAYGVSQGCGHDYSCGWLQDRDGNDLYVSYDLSQGAGQANGFGIFTDLVGNDRYYVMSKTNTQGYGNPRRDYGSIGIFLDLDGDDRYDGNGANNRYWTTHSKWGGGLDRSIPVPDTTQTTEGENAGSK